MAFRAEKRAGAFIISLLWAPSVFAQQSLQYEAWHQHSRPPHSRNARGTLTISDTGVSFQETYKGGKTPKHPHAWSWVYQDIQELKIAPKSLKVLTYKDNKWRLGADRQYEFELVSEKTFQDAYNVLKSRLDQRFVAAIADSPTNVLWQIPVKHLHSFGGDEGVLQVGPNEIVYESAKAEESRSWRYEDIDNLSSSGPFQLTITSFERARMHYGGRKGFEFQLKQRLDEARYDDLWLRLNQSKGLKVLNSYREAETNGRQ